MPVHESLDAKKQNKNVSGLYPSHTICFVLCSHVCLFVFFINECDKSNLNYLGLLFIGLILYITL